MPYNTKGKMSDNQQNLIKVCVNGVEEKCCGVVGHTACSIT